MKQLLSPAEITSYWKSGFVSVDRPLVSAGDVAVAREMLDGLFSKADELPASEVRDLGYGTDVQRSVPEIAWTTRLEPRMLRTGAFGVAREVAKELFDTPRVRLLYDHAIFKPPLGGGQTAWHQDVYFNPADDIPVVTIWLALVDVPQERGCMMFIPGSHAGAILEHEPYGRNGSQAVGYDESNRQLCPVPAGGMTAHMQRTLHAALPNDSEELRAAWIMKFVPDTRSAPRRLARWSVEAAKDGRRRLDDLRS